MESDFLQRVVEDIFQQDARTLLGRQAGHKMFHGSAKTKYCWIGGLDCIGGHRRRFGFHANAALSEEVNAAIMGDAEQPRLKRTTVVEFVELSIGLKECLLNHIFAIHNRASYPRTVAVRKLGRSCVLVSRNAR